MRLAAPALDVDTMSVVITSREPGRVERYEEFFGFGEAPFSLAPNPRYLFESASHAAALSQIAYAIERREPLVVLTGEIGTGKTLLCRTVLQRIDRKTFVSVINNPLLERDDLLKQLLQDFGAISKDRTRMTAMSRHDLVHALEDFLTSLIALQAHAVVVIDEAQHIRPDVLEQIRLLANIDDGRGATLQIILVGQTDLESLLARPELRQFQQRVSRRLRLEPLSADELRLYVEHRVAVGLGIATRSQTPGVKELERALAEWDGTTAAGVTFTPDAIQAVWTRSGGLPRVVNVLCDRALEAACAQRSRTIGAALINTAALAIDLQDPPPIDRPPAAEPLRAAEPAMPAAFPEAPAAAVSRPARTLMLTAGVAVAAAAVWFGARSLNRPGDRSSVVVTDGPAPAAEQRTSAPAPPAESTAIPTPSAAAATAAPGESTAARSTAPTADAANIRFEIVVASFRTEARAASVMADISSLGLPVRRRESNGWQQVIAGPFASRDDANEAQQRLAGAGLPQTVVVRENQTTPG